MKEMILALRGRNGQLALQLIEQAKTEGRLTADELVEAGYTCLSARAPQVPAARAAWRAGLQLMRSQSEPPCMETFSKVVLSPPSDCH